MNAQMIETVQNRVALMIQDSEIQKIMLTFESTEDAQNWIIKAAIATLFGA